MWSMAVGDDDRLDAAGHARVARRIARMLRPYRRDVAGAALAVVVFTATALAGPLLVRHGIDRGLVGRDAGALDATVVAYAAVVLVAWYASRRQVIAIAGLGEDFLRDLRVRVFDHLLRLSQAWFDRTRAGVVVSRMTSDIDSMSELVQFGLLMFVSNGLVLVASLVLLAALSWQLCLVALVSAPLVAVASVRFRRESNRAYLSVRERVGQTLSSMQEGITGVRVIQAFGREEATVRRFSRSNRDLYDAHMHSVRVSVWYFPVVEWSGLATTAAVVGVGGVLVHRGSVSLGTVVAFVLVVSAMFEPVQQLTQLFNVLQAASASLHKLFGLLDTPVELAERPGAVELPPSGELVVEGVSFAYAAREGDPDDGDAGRGGEDAGGGTGPLVLRDVGLVVAPGERLALVGPTGAGKSTLAKLMARLYDPVAGRVCFAGVDLRDATAASLRRRIVVVPQEGFLFGGTIRDNVRMARADATDAEVDAALARLGVLERFAGLPDGLDTEVQERGSRLSAGERQLVSLARAALVDPAVLVLDEATSSLDPGTESVVEAAMESLMAGRTVVVIAHRLSTAERADRVAVVDGGGIAEVGTHGELVAAGGRYAALYAAWAR